uniref:Endoplasmic reticulum junction formation protein lunapark n=1 Tax=Ditylenchus dipsaci TaxID=166011 RepID=A0A915DZ10_9BILA
MGNIFRRRRPARDELEEIVAYIKDLELQLKEHLEARSDYLRFLLYAAIFLFSVTSAYFLLLYNDLSKRLLATGGTFSVSILLFFLLRLMLLTVYGYLIGSKKKKIQYYTERKLAIIEDVKENEKFKVAKEIIEKYSTKEELEAMSGGMNGSGSVNSSDTKEDKSKQKKISANGKSADDQRRITISSMAELNTQSSSQSGVKEVSAIPKLHQISETKFQRAPVRPFVETTNSAVDRILDYVMGESISSRYALICSNCLVHNGMALKEEFEQITFFCFKCSAYNPSRNELRATKQRQKATTHNFGRTSIATSQELESRLKEEPEHSESDENFNDE